MIFVVFLYLCLLPAEGQDYNSTEAVTEEVKVTTELSICKQCKLQHFTTTAIQDKIGKMCKCVHVEHINERECISRCAGDERLEGSGYDKCNYIHGICYIYSYVEIV